MTDLLRVNKLNMHFPITGGLLKRQVGKVYAVNDVTFTLEKGETLGVVGESGCGKTTLGRALVRLYEPTSGEVFFKGANVTTASQAELKKLRSDIQMIFQDPYGSLNPRMTVKNILEEPMALHGIGNRQERFERVIELMETVGLRRGDVYKYPHEFSGGQRQRIGIARALTLNPDLIIADEPVSALDVSIQSQVLNLMVKLQDQFDLTYIFISHDLTVVKYISDRVAVMYLGHIVELSDADEIYKTPLHPYTRALLSAVPRPDPRRKYQAEILEGDVPSPSKPPPGCTFHTRCKFVQDICRREMPKFEAKQHGSPSHLVACHFADDIASNSVQPNSRNSSAGKEVRTINMDTARSSRSVKS